VRLFVAVDKGLLFEALDIVSIRRSSSFYSSWSFSAIEGRRVADFSLYLFEMLAYDFDFDLGR
jgi:hypothetical protein